MTEDLTQTVRRARDGGLDDFAVLVREFQDVTFGYAYAYLGDFHLAEDAAQEAWLRAYVELPRLREPAAFPGWMRQVTLSCCSRLVRGHRLPVVPLDLAHDLVSGEPGADERMIARELARSVRQAVGELPAHQREAVLLYYMSRCSQRQAAAFLGVPETTVKKRLYDGRRRLKERTIDMVREQVGHNAPSRDEGHTRKVLEGIEAAQTRTTGRSSLLCCFQPMLAAAGVEVSVARLAGIFGHAFSFYMKREPGRIWQDENVDWWLFWESLDLVGCRFDEVQVVGRDSTPEEVQKAKEKAWPSVTASIDRGMPAMAWQPMTLEQKERGFEAYEWALLTGYDMGQKTYTVRHKAQGTAYEIPFDGFGHSDPVGWFAVLWPAESQPVDEDEVLRRSLQQALDYARGTRFAPQEACYPADALGLAAYDLWRERLGTGMGAAEARTQAGLLRWARQAAAAFCRERAPSSSPAAASGLAAAAEHYEREAETLGRLHELCGQASLGGDHRDEAEALLAEATEAERAAVGALEGVVA